MKNMKGKVVHLSYEAHCKAKAYSEKLGIGMGPLFARLLDKELDREGLRIDLEERDEGLVPVIKEVPIVDVVRKKPIRKEEEAAHGEDPIWEKAPFWAKAGDKRSKAEQSNSWVRSYAGAGARSALGPFGVINTDTAKK